MDFRLDAEVKKYEWDVRFEEILSIQKFSVIKGVIEWIGSVYFYA